MSLYELKCFTHKHQQIPATTGTSLLLQILERRLVCVVATDSVVLAFPRGKNTHVPLWFEKHGQAGKWSFLVPPVQETVK